MNKEMGPEANQYTELIRKAAGHPKRIDSGYGMAAVAWLTSNGRETSPAAYHLVLRQIAACTDPIPYEEPLSREEKQQDAMQAQLDRIEKMLQAILGTSAVGGQG